MNKKKAVPSNLNRKMQSVWE